MLTAGLTFGMLTGCGGEEKKTYDQACADLAQGSYDYALQGYQSSITAGYKTAEAYRGAGIANIHLGNYQDAIDSLTNGLNDETGTDTYSTITAAMASLKGPKHGGANVKVTQMFEDMKATLTDWTDEELSGFLYRFYNRPIHLHLIAAIFLKS